MSYPPSPRLVTSPDAPAALISAYPFAHLFTAHDGLRSTRLPFIADLDDGIPVRLRGHLNALNPQVPGLDGAPVLVTFSGPSTYVSPHWRAEKTRAGTFDYEEVRVRGTARLLNDIDGFRRLIDDLSALIEPQYADVGDYPVWQTAMAPPGYIERLFPHITAFAIDIQAVETVSKLHQQFPAADRIAVAEHLSRSRRDESRAIAEKIRQVRTD